jgi:hypothetical protein
MPNNLVSVLPKIVGQLLHLNRSTSDVFGVVGVAYNNALCRLLGSDPRVILFA